MARWSDWYPFTEEGVDTFGVSESGVYQIALGNKAIIKYPLGETPIIYIGSAPIRTLKERLKDHLRGRGNADVYNYLLKGYNLWWCDMMPQYPYDTEQNILDNFARQYGNLPKCNSV